MTTSPDQTATADDVYARLRTHGTVTLGYQDAPRLVPALRRRAKADGLRIVASRARYRPSQISRAQARQRPTEVALTANGRDIVAPDAHTQENR